MIDLAEILVSLQPIQAKDTFAFCELPESSAIPASAIGWFREHEGVSIILPLADARAAGLPVAFVAAQITLTVHSSLATVGLTAVVSAALTVEGISCNVVAACRHDHLFVPVERAADAMRVLQQLQSVAATDADTAA